MKKYLLCFCLLLNGCAEFADNELFVSISACNLTRKIESVLDNSSCKICDNLIAECDQLILRLKRLGLHEKIPQFENYRAKLVKLCLEHKFYLTQRRIQLHFKGYSDAANEDIVTLISDTQHVVLALKNAHLLYYADKLESYIDVLMFGKKAVQCSINDVQSLIIAPLVNVPPLKFNCNLEVCGCH